MLRGLGFPAVLGPAAAAHRPDEPFGPSEEVDAIEDDVHPAMRDTVSVRIGAVMQVVRFGREDDATLL
jgi:hypothetical protein